MSTPEPFCSMCGQTGHTYTKKDDEKEMKAQGAAMRRNVEQKMKAALINAADEATALGAHYSALNAFRTLEVSGPAKATDLMSKAPETNDTSKLSRSKRKKLAKTVERKPQTILELFKAEGSDQLPGWAEVFGDAVPQNAEAKRRFTTGVNNVYKGRAGLVKDGLLHQKLIERSINPKEHGMKFADEMDEEMEEADENSKN
ncbi:hypothetical protein DOTSEDRAFT_37246 [Dothistroma septosporum NZE10]|uniref:Uncharacterized protein n=1 Tax=Dothistroma septosporum (strain NZE10 / CBS 128990) TaxID=675120 RepID=N1PCV8_DOTSN|nr:hypothetical protein DOTSEDRAFT_37246 [Dothistroma septosporum NZE10]